MTTATTTTQPSSFRGRRILVTGGAGAIGSNLVRALSSSGAGLVIVLDDLSASEAWNVPSLPNVLFVEGSVLDEGALRRVFHEGIEDVFHLAAFFANQNSVDYPERDLSVNGLGILKVLEYSRLSGIERFVYASSGCAIYPPDAPLPLTEENTTLRLGSPYQITKMLGELYCNYFHSQYGMKVFKARFFNSYGPGEVPGRYRNVIPNFVYWALREEPLPITGSGEETRDFTFVGDIVSGMMKAAETSSAAGESFNLGSGTETRVIDLAEMINRKTGNPAGVRHIPRRRWDHKDRLLASTAKAEKLFGYRPQTGFEAGLDAVIAWFRENWDRIEEAADFPPGLSPALNTADCRSGA